MVEIMFESFWCKLVSISRSVVSYSAILWTVACQAPLSMGFFRQDTGVGNHSLLQGILPTQGFNPGLPHCRQKPPPGINL